MKKVTLFLALLLSLQNFAQTDCGKDLQEAFKERYSLNNQQDIYNHFQSFFSLSETELDELSKKHESGESLEGKYEAYAVFWSRNKNKEQFRKKFRELKVRNEAGFTIDNSFYTEYYQETISEKSLEAYIECIKTLPKTGEDLAGGFYYDIVGDLLSGFTFVLKKEPESGQIEEAKIISVSTNNLDFYDSYNLKPNALIRSFTGLSQNMKLKDPNISATLTLNIDGFDPMTIEFPAYPYANFPIGSIIISTLDFNAFSAETKNKMPYSDRISKWAPADGRDVRNSDYGKRYNQLVPDMRGQFIRGKNQFFNSQEPQEFANGKDEGIRSDTNKYSYQRDATKLPNSPFIGLTNVDGNHEHTFTDQGTRYNSEEDSGGRTGTRYHNTITKKTNNDGKHKHSLKITGGGDPETTPKNIAVYYYIRINQ
ncbi:hypothetical protein [Mangrovimonas xylaniphaga]|uniref:hypothetical protein n=1 Tax=Mangrovimonas xylaniphaga TaxID=1645915 RepID=UPI000A9C8FE8|nr:hypothetical protein [Mangrovimonas xylaniphaga]